MYNNHTLYTYSHEQCLLHVSTCNTLCTFMGPNLASHTLRAQKKKMRKGPVTVYTMFRSIPHL